MAKIDNKDIINSCLQAIGASTINQEIWTSTQRFANYAITYTETKISYSYKTAGNSIYVLPVTTLEL